MGFADGGDGLEQLIHAQQSKRARIYRNDDRVSYDKSVHGRRPHGRRRVDEDDVEVGQDWLQLPAQKNLAIDLLRFQKIVSLDVDGLWRLHRSYHQRIGKLPTGRVDKHCAPFAISLPAVIVWASSVHPEGILGACNSGLTRLTIRQEEECS